MLINVKLNAAIIRTSRHKQPCLCRSSVCIHFSHLSINFQRAFSHHAACCHVISVIVRNEIIEMFPSTSLHQHISSLFFHSACPVLFWLRLCWSKWAQHMPRRAYANHLFISQAVGRPCVCQFASLDIFQGAECFMHFWGLFIYLFIYLFILFFLSLVCFYRHDATIHK